MKKHQINGIDEVYYSEQLSNGLKVIMYPSTKVKGFYITFTTKFGNVNNEFKYVDEKKFHNVPIGTAHFLEHQLLNIDKESTFNKCVSEYGATHNAYTNRYQTTYELSNNVEFSGCLKILVNAIQNPTFNDKTIAKERGIILEEYKSCLNNPNQELYYLNNQQLFINAKEKNRVIGDEETINSISLDDLSICYQYFYHPKNMILIITGNFNKEEAIKIIRNEQKLINYPKYKKIIFPKNNEPAQIVCPYNEKNMKVSIPKVSISYKFSKKKYKQLGLSDIEFQHYVSRVLSCNFGQISRFNQHIQDKKLTSGSVDFSYNNARLDVLIINFTFTSFKEEKVIELIKKQMNNLNTDKDDYQRKLKAATSSYVLLFDNIYSINDNFNVDMIFYGQINDNYYEMMKKFNYDDLLKVEKFIKDHKNNFVITKILPYKN